MSRHLLVLRAAAALLAAALVSLGTGCDDGNGSDAPDGGSPGASPDASASPGQPDEAKLIDLAETAEALSFTGEDPTDLVTAAGSVALGDFNDDGDPDLLVGAPQADGPDNKRLDAGEAYVILGPLEAGRELGAGSADVTIKGAQTGDGLGYTVLAGDLNDDGVDDILVGAPGVTAGFDPRSDQGRVYVFWGDEDLEDDPERDLAEDVFDFTVTGAEGFSRLGHAMDLGDVNGDGRQDLVVGAPFAGRKPGTAPGGERTALGEVYAFYGSDDLAGEKNVAADEYDVLISGEFAFGQFGAAVGVGDINGDGTDDIAAGAYRAGEATSGSAYVFYGRDDLEDHLAVQANDDDVAITGAAGSSFGFPVIVGNFNGDEFADLAIGSQLASAHLLERQGAVSVIYGSDDLPEVLNASDEATVSISGRMSAELYPSALAAGDLDGDDIEDVIAGSSLANYEDRAGSGAVYVFEEVGSLSGTIALEETPAGLAVAGARPDDRLGGAVAGGQIRKGERGLAVVAAGNGSDMAGVVYIVPVE